MKVTLRGSLRQVLDTAGGRSTDEREAEEAAPEIEAPEVIKVFLRDLI